MSRDDLEAYVRERSKRDPDLPQLIKAAEARQAIARKLAAYRENARLSQTQIAARMKSSPSVVSRLERGADVQLSTIQKYVAALDLSLVLDLSAKRVRPGKGREAPARERLRKVPGRKGRPLRARA
jgi:transcriptional regulator with XRE-family HTH domain